MDDARRMTALVVSRKKGVFSLVYSTCGHVYVMINLKKNNNKGEKGLARKRTNASRSRFSATLPRLSVTLFLKFS
jgi:hypothetical protein